MERLPYTGMTLRRLLMLGSAAAQERDYSVIGNPVAFRTNLAKPLSSLLIPFTPIQSLNGQDAPYPPGGGKNLLNSASAEIGTAWNGASNSARARLVIPCKPSTTYTLSMNGTNGIDNIYRIYTPSVPASSAGAEITSFPNTFTTSNDSAFIVIAFSKTAITQNDVDSLKLQLEEGSPATAYAPYSNICPISGWQGLTALRTGANLFDKSTPIQYAQYYNRVISTFRNRIITDFIPIVEGETYTFSVPSDNEANLRFINYALCDKDKNWLGGRTENGESSGFSGQASHTFTVNIHGSKYVRLILRDKINPDTLIDDRTLQNADVQLEVGSTASTYAPYTGASYPVTFPALGKNLFDINGRIFDTQQNQTTAIPVKEYSIIDGFTYTGYIRPNNTNISVSNGTLTVETTDSVYGAGLIVPVVSGEKYTFSCTRENGGYLVASYYDAEGFYMSNDVQGYVDSFTCTIPTGASYLIILLRGSQAGTYTFSNIQLEKGSSQTAYEPYAGNTIYGGTAYPLEGRALVEWVKVVVDGTNYRIFNYDNNRMIAGVAGFGKGNPKPIQQLIPFNYVKSSTDTIEWNGHIDVYGNILVYIPNTITSYQDFGDYVSEHPLEFAYELETPYEIRLDPLSIQTLIGDNVIWTDTNGQNTVTYKKKG